MFAPTRHGSKTHSFYVLAACLAAVFLLWDAANKTEHFIRRASFKSEADDFGFLVPTPNQPELAESGNDAFPLLQKITEPAHTNTPARTNHAMGRSRSDVFYFRPSGGVVVNRAKRERDVDRT